MASEALSPEDLALLDRLAARVVELRMETPAILALETGRPLTLLASQAMVFFEPIVQSLFRFPDYRRFALLVERRESVEALIGRIEEHAARARAGRRKPPAAGPPGPPSSA